MSLSERSRSTLYQGLMTVIPDEEAIGEMLSHFPARDLDEPVTRDHLRAEMATLRAEMAALDQRMTVGFAAADRRITDLLDTRLGTLDTRLGTLDTKIDTTIGTLDTKIDTKFDALDTKIDALTAELHKWLLSTTAAILLAVLGLAFRST